MLQPCIVELPVKKSFSTTDEVVNAILDNLNISYKDFMSNQRYVQLVDARVVVSHVLRCHPEIKAKIRNTSYLLNKHHSSIVWYMKKCNNASKYDRRLYQKLAAAHYLIFGNLFYLNNFVYKDGFQYD